MFTKSMLLAVAAASTALAQNAGYSQCGGQNWSGSTTCVAGYTCQYSTQYYSQCLPPSSSSAAAVKTTAKSTTAAAASTKVSTAAASTKVSTAAASTKASTPAASTKASTTAAAAPTKASSTAGAAATGVTFKASFTEYGAGDSFGSPNCNTNTAACGFYTKPGFSAAVSQNEFGVGPGAGAGPACGTCWRLTIQTDSSGNKVSNAGNSIVVMVNNLCPADGNPLCAQNGLSGTNQYGANVNFDTCEDSGASAALFGNSGVGLGLGTATEVDCKTSWTGTVVH